MTTLDHMILRVRDAGESLTFYERVVGFKYVGHSEPFEIVRVSASLTIDLLQEVPKDPVHLAFSVDHASFDELRHRLIQANVPFGDDVFVRNGKTAPNPFGARGLAESFYFYDLEQHHREARVYADET